MTERSLIDQVTLGNGLLCCRIPNARDGLRMPDVLDLACELIRRRSVTPDDAGCQALLAGQHVPYAHLGDPGVLEAIVGGGLYLSAIALLAVGLGTILRATAGALAVLVGIVFLVPALGGLFPSWMQGLFDFWPTLGAAAIFGTVPDPDFPHPWLNLGGLWIGVAAVLVAAFVVFRRRDVRPALRHGVDEPELPQILDGAPDRAARGARVGLHQGLLARDRPARLKFAAFDARSDALGDLLVDRDVRIPIKIIVHEQGP